MNNNLYNNYIPNHGNVQDFGYLSNEYVEGYLKNNIGKRIEIYVSFPDSVEWRDNIFKGILEQVGKDFIVINNDLKKYIIWCIYINYAIIDK